MRRITLLLGLLAAVAVAGVGVWLATGLNYGPGGISSAVSSAGRALVGGPFTLTDHNGRRVTEKDFLGRYMLVYFGYTWCPDVCPTELQVISAALDSMGEAAKQIQPVFVTVDPARDTVAQMKEYVGSFHPSLVGLTGTDEEIEAVAKAYRVYYAKADGGDAENYLVDHGSLIYLMGPDGQFVTHFTYGTDPEKLAEGLKAAIAANS